METVTAVLEGTLWFFRFLMGACIFSFLNVVIYRLPRGESIARGRSRCPGCGRMLTAGELVPLVSFLVQGGRCRGCGMRISKRYFAVEALGGGCFVLCGLVFGCGEWGIMSLEGIWVFAYLGILTVVALTDWDTRTIYDRFHIMILFLGAGGFWLRPEHGILDRFIGAAAVALPMLVLTLLIDGAFGGGDIKLMAASGFLLGWRAIVFAMFLGLAAGGTYCLGMLLRGKLGRKDQLAFGPFLALGLGISVFVGDSVAGWYLSLL